MPAPRRPRNPPPNVRRVERWYERQLRKVARVVGDIIGAFPPGDPEALATIEDTLRRYSATLHGWATVNARRMLEWVDKVDATAWAERSREMSEALREEIHGTDTGQLMQTLMHEQVTLIKSIPLDAAQRVHEWTIKGIEDGTRASEVAAAIRNSTGVSAAKATLIARTEVARTASKLTEARAISVGSEGYIWRTAGDTDVRDSHKRMNGKFVRWDENGGQGASLTDGTICHAGQIYNCRCYPEPVVPE